MKKSDINTSKYEIRPASPEEAGPFFAVPPEKDAGSNGGVGRN